MAEQQARRLSRSETHDLSMIIKDRTKVLKAHVAEQAAQCMADFEKKLAAIYSFDQDEVWAAATAEADKVVTEAQEKIAKRCEKLGIPKSFAPGLTLNWHGRGENASASRRAELRRVAESEFAAMSAAANTNIEKQSLDLRTQVVSMGLLSAEAKTFLETLVPVEQAMHQLEFAEVERALAQKRIATRNRWGQLE